MKSSSGAKTLDWFSLRKRVFHVCLAAQSRITRLVLVQCFLVTTEVRSFRAKSQLPIDQILQISAKTIGERERERHLHTNSIDKYSVASKKMEMRMIS